MPEITGSSGDLTNKEMEPVDSTGGSVKTIANGTSENGVSSTSPEKKSPEKSEYEVLLAQGKRHLFVKDYPNAVALLGDACAKMSEMFGELADECADAYFCYGRALLELAREESNVLGTEPEKEDSDEGDEEEGTEEVDESKGEEAKGIEKEESGEAEAKLDTIDKNDEKKVECDKDSCADETIDTTKEVNEDGEAEDKEEEVDNLQLAWEVLELAKKIFERQKSAAKLAETYLYLGEVGLESENYSGAIDDMKHCVEIQKEILAPDHRDIAETHFQLGVACSLSNDFDQAIEHFKCSSEILETRIKNLLEKGAPKAEIDKNPFYSVDKEVEEIKALLPEIKVKIADMEDFKRETIKSMMAALKGQPQVHSSDGAGSSSSSAAPVANGSGSPMKPATDISHLVRKKRKPDEDVFNDGAVKKACSDQTETSK